MIAKAVSIAASCCLLAACDGQGHIDETRMHDQVVAAMAGAAVVAHPWDAHEQLTAQIAAINAVVAKQQDNCSLPGLCDVELDDATHTALLADLRRYEAAAIKEGDQRAVLPALKKPNAAAVEQLGKNATAILAAAERAQGTESDRAFLRAAGKIVFEGRVEQRSTERAIAFFARAWAAGDAQAADDAALVFHAIGDVRNTYLWSLRCVSPCERSPEADLNALQARLLPAASDQAQAAANDKTIVALDVQS